MKEILSDFRSLILVLTVILIIIAILGRIPTGSSPDSFISLNIIKRILFVVLAIVVVMTGFLIEHMKTKGRIKPRETKEYTNQFQRTQDEIKVIIPAHNIVDEEDFEKTRFVILNGNILDARTDVIVSSDDNYLQAKGGVAKAILDKAGPTVSSELERYRRYKLKQGDLVFTTGGSSNIRAIIHPAVIDLDENRFPDEILVRKIVRRCLYCAIAFGAKRIAFPVIGGGTGSLHLKASESYEAIVSEVVKFLQNDNLTNGDFLTYVALYVFNSEDITGKISEVITKI